MKKFYTNGVSTIKIEEGQEIPDGFHLGRTFNAKPWNKGLKAATNEKVRDNCEKCHQKRKEDNNYHSWNKGLSKNNNSSLQIVSEKVSKARKGKPSWNKGIPAEESRKQKQSNTMKQKAKLRTQEQINAINEKSRKTKLKNNSFKTSVSEDEYLNNVLLSKYDIADIERQYKDPRYPFNCDFYIKSEDLFIELNLNWTHGMHPFDDSSVDDLNTLAIWKEKSLKSQFYKNAIDVWTRRDVEKLNIMRKNNLNFMVIYPKDMIINKVTFNKTL